MACDCRRSHEGHGAGAETRPSAVPEASFDWHADDAAREIGRAIYEGTRGFALMDTRRAGEHFGHDRSSRPGHWCGTARSKGGCGAGLDGDATNGTAGAV